MMAVSRGQTGQARHSLGEPGAAAEVPVADIVDSTWNAAAECSNCCGTQVIDVNTITGMRLGFKNLRFSGDDPVDAEPARTVYRRYA
jgi:hypothetical protein